jgi:CheY-like chemotaxis protein
MYKTIMLIDDDDDDQEIFLAAVEKVSKSVSCLTFSDASEALKQLIKDEVLPDLIFLDLNMPVMNGQQFLHLIKKDLRLKNIPITIFSTSNHPPTIAATKELGAHDFITKPGSFDGLVMILQKILT